MISVSEATALVLANLHKPAVETRALTDALGFILAEPIRADRDAPPFDRVTMDGIAILYKQFQSGQRDFQISAVQAAGEPRKKLAKANEAVEVMTGAILPEGTDTVIRYEDLKIEDTKARVLIENVQQFQSVHRQGIDATKDAVLLEPGTRLSPAEIALLASVGKSKVDVLTFPTTAIVSSGDELVEISSIPLDHQIRRSNSYAIQSAMQALGWNASQFHLPDNKTVLKQTLEQLIQSHSVLILSGGVSQGKFDFIPGVLEELGVRKVFHHVSQRPGKPFWFGQMDGAKKVVFALPGNPVSTFMCFYRFVKPWLLRSLGVTEPALEAILAQDFSFNPPLTYFLQVNVANEKGRMLAYPYAGGGSGDFINLKKVTGFLELPQERNEFKAGEAFPYIPFRL